MTAASWVSYVLRRAVQVVPLLVGVITANFVLIHAAPGDPASVLAGKAGAATPEFVEQLRTEFGLDRPLQQQFLIYLGEVVRGNLGRSHHYGQSVLHVLRAGLIPTLLLMGAALAFAVVGGIAIGIVAAHAGRRRLGRLISTLALVAYATPLFWLGLMLVIVFSIWLEWFPVQGFTDVATTSVGLAYASEVLHHLVLPAVTLGVFYMALYIRLMRASMLEVLQQDYVTVARAKGLPEWRVQVQHVLRNALIPVVTIAGLHLGQMLGGSVVVETVFAWPGLGRVLFEAAFNRDYPVLLGGLVFSTIAVVATNLATDLAYRVLDPRIGYR